MIVMAVCSQVGFLTVSAAAEEVKSGPQTYVFRKSEKKIGLSGVVEADEEWNDMEWTTLSYRRNENGVTSADGYSAKFKGLWKMEGEQKYLYYIVDVYNPRENSDGMFQFYVEGQHSGSNGQSFGAASNADGVYYLSGKLFNIAYAKADNRETTHHWTIE